MFNQKPGVGHLQEIPEQEQEYQPQKDFKGYLGPDENSFQSKFNQIDKKNKILEIESRAESIQRQIAQYGARAYETIAGWPGNLKKAFGGAKDYLDSQIDEIRETIGIPRTEEQKEKYNQFEEENSPRVGGLVHSLMNPPTSSEIRGIVTPEIAQKLGGDREYLEPKNESEENRGEFTQDLTSMFTPGSGSLRTITRIGAPIVGTLVKEGVKFLGGDEETAQKAKLGTMLMTTMALQSDPMRYAHGRIAEAKSMVPDNYQVPTGNLTNRLTNVWQRTRRGLQTPSKSRAQRAIQDLVDQSEQGRIPLRNLMDSLDDINELISEAGGFDVPRIVRDRTIANLNQVKRGIRQTIDENLVQLSPQAAELYRTGYEAAAVTHQSNAITNFINKNFGKKASSVGAKLLFPSLGAGAALAPKATVGAGLTYPLYKAGQVMYRVANSPTLGRYYSEVMRASVQGNVPAMVNNLQKLDKALLKEEKKEKPEKESMESFKNRFKNMD